MIEAIFVIYVAIGAVLFMYERNTVFKKLEPIHSKNFLIFIISNLILLCIYSVMYLPYFLSFIIFFKINKIKWQKLKKDIYEDRNNQKEDNNE